MNKKQIMSALAALALALAAGCSNNTAAPGIDDNVLAGMRNSIRANAYGVEPSHKYERYEVMVPMDDGVRLRTIVYKPEGDDPWPAAFTRGPYPHQEPIKDALGEEYASRDFAYVYQYCRGKGGSEGEYVANVDERADGIASLNWLNSQD